MKTASLFILLIAFYIVACHEEESIQQGKVQFSFTTAGIDDAGGRTQVDNIPAGSMLRITVTRDNGDNVLAAKKIELVKVGDGFVTTPITLPKGHYNIDDFMIVSATDSLLFAVPKRKSPLAQWVKNPLAISFNIGGDAVSNIEGEVISAERKTAKDFGYASFGVKVATASSLSIAAFTNDPGNVKLATANAFVLHGKDTVIRSSIAASVNNMTFTGAPKTTYTLVITKDGYAKYQRAFLLDTLTKPLTAVLEPALTVSWTLTSSTIYLDGNAGAKLQIDWGDNTVEKADLQTAEFSHTYSAAKKYFVSITGDLDAIKFFEIEYQDGINHVSPVHLTALEDFRLPLCEYRSQAIDFSGNAKLQNLDLSGLRAHLAGIDISHNTALLNLDLQGDNFSSTVMDKLIDDLYASCTGGNKRNGYLNVHTILFDNPYHPTNQDLIGPPSSVQVDKLHKLVDNFGWFVFPINTLPGPDAPDGRQQIGTGRLNNAYVQVSDNKLTLIRRRKE